VQTRTAELLIAGDVYTQDPAHPWTQAVAVGGGRVLAVGSPADVAEVAGPRTRRIDLPGRLVLPAFQDAHIHPPESGMEMTRCYLHDATGASDTLDRIRAYAAAHPEAGWILGGGWALDHFPGGTPTRQELDGVVSDRPAFLTNRDGHDAWVNSVALRMAGVSRDTPDPPDGRIERVGPGEPAGTLHEGAMSLVERHVPPPSETEWEAAVMRAQEHLHSLGITAWQDAIVHPENLATYRALAADGRLTARVVAALWWDRHRGADQLDELMEGRDSVGEGRVRATSVKIMQDGIVENFTAAMLEPYLDGDGRPLERGGLSFVDPDRLKGYVTRLDAQGFQVHFHAIGDRAVREALDAIEAARATNGPNDQRHHIAHLQAVHPDDVPRFAALDVTANCQPYWACLDAQMRELNVQTLGPERVMRQYPFGSLKRAGARLAFGSDWSVSTANPLHEMQVAMTRMPFDEPEVEPLTPEERLDLGTCLEAFTLGSAFVNHLDDVTGSVVPGKLADLVVLDANPFAEGAGPIGECRVILTLVDGQPVYADPSVGW
jgi:predicted amidohydrolase YtcJ